AWLVADLLRDAAREGTARAAAVEGLAVAAKTGTPSERRDARRARHARGLLTAVSAGRGDGRPLALARPPAAAPPWRASIPAGGPAGLAGGGAPVARLHAGRCAAAAGAPPRAAGAARGAARRRAHRVAGAQLEPARPAGAVPRRCDAAARPLLAPRRGRAGGA